MVQQLIVPSAGESIQEVQIGQWLKKTGQWVEQDEPVVELETDKASLEIPAPVSGVLEKILKQEGDAADVGEAIAIINDEKQPADASVAESEAGPLPAPVIVMPAAQRLLSEHGIQAVDVPATGPHGRLLKEDVLQYIEQLDKPDTENQPEDHSQEPDQVAAKQPSAQDRPSPATPPAGLSSRPQPAPAAAREAPASDQRQEESVPMSMIRRRIAERLVQAQQVAVLLTTFNEVDMTEVMQLRKRYQEEFREKYGVKLGFMSFFTKATSAALQRFPALNAEIRGQDIVYRNFCDMGIAIGSSKGLVVPVLRNAERMGFAEIEQQIGDFSQRAANNKLRPDELEGGTFTITNGGVFGSLLSTPIVNAPQSGVLGLHAIQERPVARDGQVVIRPMMYVALTYDHRVVDGRKAVTFLKQIKELIEDPARLLLEV